MGIVCDTRKSPLRRKRTDSRPGLLCTPCLPEVHGQEFSPQPGVHSQKVAETLERDMIPFYRRRLKALKLSPNELFVFRALSEAHVTVI